MAATRFLQQGEIPFLKYCGALMLHYMHRIHDMCAFALRHFSPQCVKYLSLGAVNPPRALVLYDYCKDLCALYIISGLSVSLHLVNEIYDEDHAAASPIFTSYSQSTPLTAHSCSTRL